MRPTLKHVVVSGANAHGHDTFEDLIAVSAPEDYTAPTTRDDIAFWLYTSGSTGKPKGAVHVHASLKLTNDLYAAPILGLQENDVCYSVAKLFFAYGLGNAMTFPMSVGATTVLLADRPTPDGVAALLRKHPVTVFYGVPTFYAGVPREREHAGARGDEIPPLRVRRRSACRPMSASAGARNTAATFSTASARPRCCTSFCPTRRARPNTAPPASRCRATS